MGQTGRRQVDCSRVVVRQQQMWDQPSCHVEDRPETVKQGSWKATLLLLASCVETVHVKKTMFSVSDEMM